MGILFSCPQCQKPLNVKSQLAGRRGFCPHCNDRIEIPKASQLGKSEFAALINAESSLGNAESTRQSDATAPPDLVSEAAKVMETADVERPQGGEVFVAGKPGPPTKDPYADSNCVWYVRPPSGGQFGPASNVLMKQWVQEGRVTADSYVWQEGWMDWKVAGDALPDLPASASTVSTAVDDLTIPKSTRRYADYKRARRRRTMLGIIGLLMGSIIVVALIVLLFIVVNQQQS